jgi:hypothetical protein
MKPIIDGTATVHGSSVQVRAQSAVEYAVLKSLTCQATYSKRSSVQMQPGNNLSDYVIDFVIMLRKRRIFAYVELKQFILNGVISKIRHDKMQRGDMFVRRVEVHESCQIHRPSKCWQDMFMYKLGDQQDGRHSTNGQDHVMQSAKICCMRCSGEFSLLKTLKRKHANAALDSAASMRSL